MASIYSNCTQGTCRAEELTGSAAGAKLLVHDGNQMPLLVLYHPDGTAGAVTGAVSAMRTAERDAERAVHPGRTYMILSLFLTTYPKNRSAGAKLSALGALGLSLIHI